jgi:20S proteasome subunit alpha 5
LALKRSLRLDNQIDSHAFCLVSGLIADSQRLVENARSEAHYHRFIYKEPISVKALTQSVADLALNFGEGDITSKRKPIARPYGVSLLFAGIDHNGPVMFHSDPSGTMVGYLAKGLGSAEEGIQSLLDKFYKPTLTVAEGEKLGLAILKQVMEEKIRNDLVDLFSFKVADTKFGKKTAEEIQVLLQNLPNVE